MSSVKLSTMPPEQLDMALELVILEGEISLAGKELGQALSRNNGKDIDELLFEVKILIGTHARVMMAYCVLYGS